MRHIKLDEYTPEDAQVELFELLVKSGRRCAYDLQHAVDHMPSGEFRDMLERRAGFWKTVFNPASGMKDYRHKLHCDIDELEMRVAGLLRLCKENGIDPGKYDDPVF